MRKPYLKINCVQTCSRWDRNLRSRSLRRCDASRGRIPGARSQWTSQKSTRNHRCALSWSQLRLESMTQKHKCLVSSFVGIRSIIWGQVYGTSIALLITVVFTWISHKLDFPKSHQTWVAWLTWANVKESAFWRELNAGTKDFLIKYLLLSEKLLRFLPLMYNLIFQCYFLDLIQFTS